MGIEKFIVEAADLCSHEGKVPQSDPRGGTLCLGCAALALREFLSRRPTSREQLQAYQRERERADGYPSLVLMLNSEEVPETCKKEVAHALLALGFLPEGR